MTRASSLLLVLLPLWLGGCACPRGAGGSFDLARDSFAFENELRWSYEFPVTGGVVKRKTDPETRYSLRCFPMVRAAREFYYHARFQPGLPRLPREDYRERVRQVMRRNSRCPANPGEEIIIPGFANLHEFSVEHADLLKEAAGGSIQSFLQRGNWRMVFPLSEASREQTARTFVSKLRAGQIPLAHIYRFPDTSLNHALLIYSAAETESSIIFSAYDPNDPTRPAILTYDRETRTFHFEQNRYFAGGPIRVYEVYRGWFY